KLPSPIAEYLAAVEKKNSDKLGGKCCESLCPSILWPSTQACDVDIFHDKVSQPYSSALPVSQKIALGRLPSLCPLILGCLDVVIQLKRGDGLVRLLLSESQLLHEVVSLLSPHINVLLHHGFHVIVHGVLLSR